MQSVLLQEALQKLDRPTVQLYAKKFNVKANAKTADIIKCLIKLYPQGVPHIDPDLIVERPRSTSSGSKRKIDDEITVQHDPIPGDQADDPTTRSAKRSKTSRLPVKASTPRPHSRRVSARDAPPASSRIATDVPIEPPAIAAPNPPLVILDCQCQHAHERPRPTIPPNPSSRSPHITITVQDFHAAHNLLLMQITKLNNTEQEILNCRHLVDAADEMLAGLENDFTILKDLRVRMEDWVAGWKGDQTLPPRYVM